MAALCAMRVGRLLAFSGAAIALAVCPSALPSVALPRSSEAGTPYSRLPPDSRMQLLPCGSVSQNPCLAAWAALEMDAEGQRKGWGLG